MKLSIPLWLLLAVATYAEPIAKITGRPKANRATW